MARGVMVAGASPFPPSWQNINDNLVYTDAAALASPTFTTTAAPASGVVTYTANSLRS